MTSAPTPAVKMSVFRPVFLDRRVPLAPTEFRDAAADIDDFLLKKIRGDLEGRCCAHGWVRGGSTQILARSMGQAEHCRFTGDFLYQVKVRVLCFLPEAGQTVDAQILKTNKLGAYALLVDQGRVSEAIRILLPRDLHIGNQEFDELGVDAIVRVRLLRSRFQANDAFIQAVGTYEGMSTTELRAGGERRRLRPDVAATEGGEATTAVEESKEAAVAAALPTIPEAATAEETEEVAPDSAPTLANVFRAAATEILGTAPAPAPAPARRRTTATTKAAAAATAPA
jgi:DNA-directed RNA polymerase subunit E'/Rpb7